jgi:hypothetical protein
MIAAAGYTRIVSWKQRISVVALVVLAAVPVSRVLCAMVCGWSAETSSAHHGSAAAEQCDELAPSSTGVRIEAVSHHDCAAHDAAFRQSATAAAQRIGGDVAPAPSGPMARYATIYFGPATGPVFESRRPPGSAPPTIPLNLRV